ncbi:DUF397 domain-containing protein [Actinomadura parmotrematis]|uniref:DUF397 domain-containing protein n=1 Tax=Actinomadura parmotrematis TaxID=2864039 RepID=A0ABS7FP46_9ACTN|nr:DUF397 domain-containing protein [Actinomadura parmotrematis]MBW8482137.1 DUF397 domain-containing protein [Actinomadura parmotrematis]
MATLDPTIIQWRKSSRSGHSGGDCVEVADLAPALEAQWRKSSRSAHQGGECVEVADLASVVAVRDSKDPEGPRLALKGAAWSALAERIKTGALDLA